MPHRMIAIALATLALTGCFGPVPATVESAPPAPLASTTADDQAIMVAFRTLDAITSAVDALRDAGILVPGTPAAIRVANGLEASLAAMNAASAAQRAGQSSTYAEALTRALVAINEVRVGIAAMKGAN